MPDFAVVTAFKAIDKQTPIYNKMGNSAERYGIRGSRAMQRVNRAQSALIGKMKLYAGMGIGIAAGLITREFINFDHAITAASAKFSELQDNTEESRQALEKLKLTARAVGRDTQYSATQAAQGIDFLAMAGFNARQSIVLLPGVTNLATVANVDLARATDIASDAIGAFGMQTKNTEQLTKNFTRIQDVMAATMTRSNTNMEDLFETIKKGAPAFTAAGQSLETFNALAGIMANSGLKGADSGTNLRNIMLRLAKPTGEAAKTIDNLGIRIKSANGNFRDIVDILTDFEKSTKNMGTAQRTAALSTIFGARAVTGVNILLKEGNKNIRTFRQGLLEAGGASEKMAGIMRQSLLNRLKALLSAVIELGFRFIDAFSKQGGNAIDKLTSVARNLGIVFEILGKIFSKVAGLLPYIISGFLAYKTVLIGIWTTQKVMIAMGWIKYIIMMRSVILKAAMATKTWAIAQKILNMTLKSGKFYAIIAILTLLAGVTIYLVKNWDKFSTKTKIVIAVLATLAGVVTTVIGVIKLWRIAQIGLNIALTANPIGLIIVGIGALIAGIILLVKHWDAVKYHVLDFVDAARIKMLEFSIMIREKVIGVLQKLVNKFADIPIIGKMFKKVTDWQDGILKREKDLIKVLEQKRVTRTKEYEKLKALREKDAANAKQKNNEIINSAKIPDITTSNQNIITDNRRSPNEVEARARRIDFQGRIDIAGAPEGTRATSKTKGAPAILLELLGAN